MCYKTGQVYLLLTHILHTNNHRNPIHHHPRINPRHDIIDHYPQATTDMAVKQVYRPGFPDIEQAEQAKPYQHP